MEQIGAFALLEAGPLDLKLLTTPVSLSLPMAQIDACVDWENGLNLSTP